MRKYCIDGEFTFDPDYIAGGNTFVKAIGPSWVTIDSGTGEVSIDTNSVTVGVYSLLITYSYGEGQTGKFTEEIAVEDCAVVPMQPTISVCEGQNTDYPIILSDGLPHSGFEIVSVSPTNEFITISGSGVLGIESDVNVGTYVIEISYSGGENFEITLNVVACSTPTTAIADCPLDPIGIVWVNQEGGRQSYWFNQPKSYSIEQQGGETWKNTDLEQRWFNKGIVSEVTSVEQQFIPEGHLSSINSLKNSIQAWICTDISNASTYKSILIEEDSWVWKKTLSRFYTLAFTFRLSNAKLIQKQ
jgi:hypothetical protein